MKTSHQYVATHTLLLQEHTTLGDDDRHVSVDVAGSILVDKGDGDIRVRDALSERNAEDSLGSDAC